MKLTVVLISKPLLSDRHVTLYKKLIGLRSNILLYGSNTDSKRVIRDVNPTNILCFGPIFDGKNYESFQSGNSWVLQIPDLTYILNHSSHIAKSLKAISEFLGDDYEKNTSIKKTVSDKSRR